MMVTALSAAEAQNYEEIGPLKCQELTKLPDIEESCRNQLRNDASSQGADIIVIESHDIIDCWPNKSHDCLQMTGRAYHRKPKQT